MSEHDDAALQRQNKEIRSCVPRWTCFFTV